MSKRRNYENLNIKRVARTLTHFFQSKGIRIMRYDAYSTNSVYLKLDYGELWSIRISDHKGYKHLHYRFNVIRGYRGPRYDGKREYYGLIADDLNDLCKSILLAKKRRVKQLGLYKYQDYMEMEHRRHLNDKKVFGVLHRI